MAQRLEDLKKSNTKDFLMLQPRYLVLARRGLGSIPPDIETSRLTLLRSWVSWWSEREKARLLAASARQIGKDASALSAAAREAEQRKITAHLIRGYQLASEGDEEAAFEEFEAATKVTPGDILSRDIAAGWARRINKPKRESELLVELQNAASSARAEIHQARSLRREAELLDKRQNESDWRTARDILDMAHDLLQPSAAEPEAKLELGRVLTLFCEVQCHRKRVGHVDARLTRMRTIMEGVKTSTRTEEQHGEAYGEERALAVERSVAELRGDLDASDDDNA